MNLFVPYLFECYLLVMRWNLDLVFDKKKNRIMVVASNINIKSFLKNMGILISFLILWCVGGGRKWGLIQKQQNEIETIFGKHVCTNRWHSCN